MKISTQFGMKEQADLIIQENDTFGVDKKPYDKTIYLVVVKRPVEDVGYEEYHIASFYSYKKAQDVLKEIDIAKSENRDYKPSGISVWDGIPDELEEATGAAGWCDICKGWE